jgi:hypothetical protein
MPSVCAHIEPTRVVVRSPDDGGASSDDNKRILLPGEVARLPSYLLFAARGAAEHKMRIPTTREKWR